MKIVGVGDTVLGYGSPQIQQLMSSLAEHHGTRALVLEPQNPKRASKHELCPEIDIETIPVSSQPFSWPTGRAEYVKKLAKRINELRPDVLVIFCTFCVPLLKWLDYRPKRVIYHAIEMIEQYGTADVWSGPRPGKMLSVLGSALAAPLAALGTAVRVFTEVPFSGDVVGVAGTMVAVVLAQVINALHQSILGLITLT